MKRTLTTIAAASMALGTLVPVAFASTTASKLQWSKVSITAGSYTANPEGFAADDYGSTTPTTFVPVYYVQKALTALGYTVNWDGTNLNVTTPSGVSANLTNISVGSGNAGIYVNGTLVKKVYKQVQKDPAGGASAQATTYVPIYYINTLLTAAGESAQWSGSGWALTKPTTSTVAGATLSAIKTSGASSGDGSAANPAISLTNAAINASTTLTDLNGNALVNTAVTFNVSNYGNPPSTLPTVENAAGTVVSGTAQSNAEQYTVYTDNSGVATISITNPSGQTNAYQLVATGPYLSQTNTAVSTQPAFVEFVSNNTAGIAPYAQSSNPFNGTIGTPVPVTVTLPPNAAGQPQANVLVTLTVLPLSNATPAGHASFVNAQGAVLGQQIQVTTNSAGIAQTYLSDSYVEKVNVTVSGLPTGVNAPNTSYFSFAQSGVPSKINNISVSSNTPNIGQNVVVSGQLEDASGNPVPAGQILVTSPNVGIIGGAAVGSNKFAYVSGTTTTTFPLVASVATGAPATSAYGDLVTADSAGNFNFQVTDPRVEAQDFYIYPVSNGQVQSGTALNAGTTNNYQLSFAQSTNVAYLSVGAFDAYVQGNSDTTTTGLSAIINAGGNIAGTLPASQVANVFVEPQNSAGHHSGGDLTATALTYSLSVDNGGLIYSINGHPLLSPAAAVTVAYNGAGGFTANGVSIGALNVSPSTYVSDFSVGVSNANAGNTNLTITSGSVSSKATINFTGAAPAQVATFNPGSVVVNPGSQETVSFQVQDLNGNPVPKSSASIALGATSGWFVMSVNGSGLQQTVNMGSSTNPSYTNEATPIPLGSYNSSLLNYSVGIPGVASWTNGNRYFTVYSDANGNVQLLLQAGGLNYPTIETGSNTANPNNYAPAAAGNGWLGFYSNSNGDTSTPLFVYESPSTPAATYTGNVNGDSFSGSLLGQINW